MRMPFPPKPVALVTSCHLSWQCLGCWFEQENLSFPGSDFKLTCFSDCIIGHWSNCWLCDMRVRHCLHGLTWNLLTLNFVCFTRLLYPKMALHLPEGLFHTSWCSCEKRCRAGEIFPQSNDFFFVHFPGFSLSTGHLLIYWFYVFEAFFLSRLFVFFYLSGGLV